MASRVSPVFNPKKRIKRPGRHRKRLNKRDKVKNFL